MASLKWSKEDELRAEKEGWKLRLDSAIRAFNSFGGCPFSNIHTLYDFLRTQSETSEWHRNVYMQLNWFGPDSQAANKLGWGITIKGLHGILTIEQLTALAQEGSIFHQKAMTWLAKLRLKSA